MTNEDLVFKLREKDDAHPHATVVATGEGKDFSMFCGCLACLNGALICPQIVAVIREDKDRVMYGQGQFEELRKRSNGSRLTDPNNGYWKFYPLA